MADKIHYGLDNPHPLFNRKTELVWDGKYDEYGRRREVDIAGCAMPLQKIETIDEPLSHATAQGELELFAKESRRLDDARNRLIWGDNKLVMASLLAEFKGKVDLIYIDPPFDVGADFTMDVPIGDGKETVGKDQSTLEMVAYRDMWGKGTDSYLHMMSERFGLMKELLSSNGSIFVHCDARMNYLLRSLLHETFAGMFRNEIVWCYYKASNKTREFPNCHQTIFWYSNSGTGWQFNSDNIRVPYDEKTLSNYKEGLAGSGTYYEGQIKDDSGVLNQLGKVPEDWWTLPLAARFPPDGVKRTGEFGTSEKSWPLIERVIKTASKEGDLVADFFGGSGITAAVAESLARRWVISDLGRFAIHTSRKRLIQTQRLLHSQSRPYRAFDVYNLGRYERQWWQKERLHGADDEHRKVVLGFYKAEPLPSPTALLHGRKGRALVHVDAIDSILTRGELELVVKAARDAGADEVHCLAWEFEMDLRLVCHALEASEGVRIKLIPIPREIMEKNRTSPPPFLEVAVLEAEPIIRMVKSKATVDIKLTRFLPSLAEVPSKELEALKERAMKSGFDFIDFWAVDFDWRRGKPFEHNWQDYRTRKDRSLKTVSDFGYDRYPSPGKYTACVKVVDVFGCDTSITVEVQV